MTMPKLPPEYTWQQTWRFFLLGMFRATCAALLPVAYDVWDWFMNWSGTPIDWWHMAKLAGACAIIPAGGYWKKHWKQLKVPPAFEVPDSFLEVTQTTTIVQSTTTKGSTPQ